MEVYVKESLYVLDYNNNKTDAIFISDDKITPGYAYNINIKEENTGYSDLTFSMPDTIIDDEGNIIKNPRLKLLVPLVKLRYERVITYTGDKDITVQEPSGYGDTTTFTPVKYEAGYPKNIIERHVMDYIVQPVNKQRTNLKIDPSFTAIDYPRFNLSKKKVGLEITNSTITRDEWSLYTGEPYSVDGTIKYVKWTQAMSDNCYLAGFPAIPTEFNAKTASSFPLYEEHFQNLNIKVGQWPYGYNGTAFYWPVSETGRFKGKMFKKGDYLVLRMYDFYDGVKTENNIVPSVVWDNTRYSWNWDQLLKTSSYLSPNNALNYLRYVLENTNWSIATRPDGTPDVDIEKIEVPTPAGSTTNVELKDSTCQLNLTGSNCYNAITSICQSLQLYPIFDCENRTVALRLFAGKNYGLTYSLGRNLNSDTIKLDGEKVITKLYVSGGKDYNGDANIHIGDAVREYTKHNAGFYKDVDSLPTSEGYIYAIVDDGFTDKDFQTIHYDNKLNASIIETHDSLVKDYWKVRGNRSVYFYDNTTNSWSQGTLLPTGNWKGVVNGLEYIIDPISGVEGEWDPNDDIYISQRSPWGTNYIMNLKWSYQNGWITREQILGLYQINQKINDLNEAFVNKYTEDRLATQQEYNEAKNNYDISQDEYESTINNMMAKYYNNDDDYSEGTTRCFHVYPKDIQEVEIGTNTYEGHIRMFHCYKCGETRAYTNSQTEYSACPVCSATGDTINNDSIKVHKYGDYNFKHTDGMYPKTRYEGYQYNPHIKGTFLRLVTTLDCKDKSSGEPKGYTIQDYEDMISIVTPINYRGAASSTFDGYDYMLGDLYIKSSSGQIENWNESIATYINAYGKALDYYEEVKVALEKIEELTELYKKWDKITDEYYSEMQEKYGDYIIEGDYKNDEQPYVGLLFKEGLEASDKFSIPKVTYTLDVIDSSGLIEYRKPMTGNYICGACGYTNNAFYSICPQCGSESFIKTIDTYNDLVHSLHNAGQIVPHAGDYCQIYDEKMGLFGVPALITEISRVLDQPVNNKINLDTSYTDDETLVGNIITATNTVLNNADIYARTAVLKADGTMDSDSIKNTLESASGSDITIVGTNGSILLNGSGLRAVDPNDPNRAMKYSGNGIFCTTNLQPDNGEAVTWDKLMTPTGINANYINAGTIDAQKVNIMSGLSGKVILDQFGLAVKQNTDKGVRIESFDTNLATKDVTYAGNWGLRNNIASFIGVDSSNNPLIYTKGFLVAGEGSNIANWITSDTGFYHLTGTTKDLWLSPNGIRGTVYNNTKDMLIYAKEKFGVDTEGIMYASGAKISGSGEFTGKIVINTDDSSMTKGSITGGNIGGMTITSDSLYTYYKDDKNNWINGTGLSSNASKFAFWAGESNYVNGAASSDAKFKVGHDGILHAKGAIIDGSITATSGNIGGCVIDGSGSLKVDASHITSLNADVINAGTLSAAYISGGTISSSGLKITNGTGFFKLLRSGSLHPWMSAINLPYDQGNGINFLAVDKSNVDTAINADMTYARIYGNSAKALNITNSSSTINIEAAKGIAIRSSSSSSGNGYIRFVNDGNCMMMDGSSFGRTTAADKEEYKAHITLNENMYIIPYKSTDKCYYGPGGKSSWAVTDEIATKGLSPSTLNIKENVKKKDTSKLLDVLSNIELYEYNYIKDVEDGKQDYGYIIDYIEKIPGIKDYIDFIPSTIKGHDTKQINNEQLTKFLLGAVIELNKEIKQIKKESE